MLPMGEFIITYRGTVYPWHGDHMRHLNVVWNVGKFNEATGQILAGVGAGPSRLRKKDLASLRSSSHRMEA